MSERRLVTFHPETDPPGVRVRDELGGGELLLGVDGPVTPEPALPERFVFPVDAAVAIRTGHIRIPPGSAIAVRDGEGEFLGEVTAGEMELPEGRYYLDISGQLKVYALVETAAPSFRQLGDAEMGRPMTVEFEPGTPVVLGGRSVHDRPDATVTVPSDPERMARGLSVLGSSLKELSVERSWPTLRGHPPGIRLGERLDIPAALSVPESGVVVRVPANLADLYRVAPLAFYFGARIEPGSRPALVLEGVDHEEPLGTGNGLESRVDRLLARSLLLDSLVRRAGYYSHERLEYERLAAELPFYPSNLYDRTLEEQLMEYLEVPWDELEPYVPRWPRAVRLTEEPADVEYLSPVLHTLSRVHVGQDGSPATAGGVMVTSTTGDPARGESRLVREAFVSGRERPGVTPTDATLGFVGESDACRRGLETVRNFRGPPDDDSSGSPSVHTTTGGTVAAVSTALETPREFLSVSATLSDSGIHCADGMIRPRDLPPVGATVLALPACESAADAASLVRAGATAVVHGTPESPLGPTVRGRIAGHLLWGFPLADATTLAEPAGANVRFAGDATRCGVRRPRRPTPYVVDVVSETADEHRVTFHPRATWQNQLGGVTRLTERPIPEQYQLIESAVEAPLAVSTAGVVDLLRDDALTVRLDGSVVHDGTDLEADDVRGRLGDTGGQST